jgi:hypothetical protein
MAKVIDLYKDDHNMTWYLDVMTREMPAEQPVSVGIVFWHGLGDCIQFIDLYDCIRSEYPRVGFDIMIQANLGQEYVWPDAVFLDNLDHLADMDYEYIFLVTFPVETDPDLTKSELSNKMEIGLDKYRTEYGKLEPARSRLIGIGFQNTALPDVFNVPEEIGKSIWNAIIDEGCVPMEISFEHAYHNPVNKRYDFITCSARGAQPTVGALVHLISSCAGFIGVPSGPLHCALSIDSGRVLYLDKGIPIERFIHDSVPSIDLKAFDEEKVREWLRDRKS